MTPTSKPVGRQAPNPVASLTQYELAHLAAHLAAVAREHDLHGLLALEWSRVASGGGAQTELRNAWYEAKVSFGDTAGWLDDVDRAWRLADRAEPSRDERAAAVNTGRQCRCTLLISSFNSLAAKIPAALLGPLVTTGFWTIQSATA